MTLYLLVGLIGSATLSPGPNNMLVATTAARQGFRATLPCIAAVTLAGALMICAASGLLAQGVDPMVMKTIEMASCGILIWLAIAAWDSAGEKRMKASDRPITPLALFALQLANPKAILLTLTVTASARACGLPLGTTCALVALISGVSLMLWAAGAAGMATAFRTPASGMLLDRLLSLVLVGNALALFANALEP